MLGTCPRRSCRTAPPNSTELRNRVSDGRYTVHIHAIGAAGAIGA